MLRAGAQSLAIWRSGDGVRWSRVTPLGALFELLASHQAVVYDDRLWVIGGWDEGPSQGGTATARNEVWSSSDGVNWVQETTAAAFGARAAHEVVSFAGSLWLFGGGDGAAVHDDVWVSSDGANWTAVAAGTPRYSARLGHAVAVFGDAMWLVGGTDDTDYDSGTVLDDVWSTVDGINWTQHAGAAAEPDGGGQVALAAARRAEQDQVGTFVEPAVAASERHHLRFGDHGDGVEVEVRQRLTCRQLSLGEVAFDAAPGPVGEFLFGQRGQGVRGWPAFLIGLLTGRWPWQNRSGA